MNFHPFFIAIAGLCCWCLPLAAQQPHPDIDSGNENSPIEYSRDSIMKRLDKAHRILNRINVFMDDEFDTRRIERKLPAVGNTLQVIANNLALLDAVPEFKSLQLYGVLLDNILSQLSGWRSALFRYDKHLADIDTELSSLGRDSALRQLAKDSLYLQLYLDELRELRRKWEQAHRSTTMNLTRIKTLQLRVSKQYFLAVDLRSQASWIQRRLTERLFRKEFGYLWQGESSHEISAGTRELSIRSYRSLGSVIGYFLDRNRYSYICILLIGTLFTWWLRHNLRTVPGPPTTIRPVLYALIIVLNLHPLFELHASTFPVSQIPLLLVLSILFGYNWRRRELLYWSVIVALYAFLLVTRTMLIAGDVIISLLVLNLLSVTVGYYATKRLAARFDNLVKISLWVYLLLNILAIGAGIGGRLSLARIFSTAALFGVVQTMALSVGITCLQESFRLQVAAGVAKGYDQKWALISNQLEKGLFRLLHLSVLLIWLLSLAINLNMYDYGRKLVRQMLYHPLKFGSLSFQPASLLLFFLILFLSNFLQKYAGVIFGSADGQTLPDNVKNGSRLAMLRLLIIISGFLLAVGASGVPLDKITIILGALGVGIGLGLQNIVNNLVSGFILVFERPFQIGDLIELNRKKGIVRDIGIRSSKIVTEDGAEVIIPNGDLLSGQVINWTVRAHRVRITISLTVEAGHTLQEIEALVQTALADQPGITEGHKPHVLINSASEKSTNITVLAWVSNIARTQAVKSEVLSRLYQEFREKGWKMI